MSVRGTFSGAGKHMSFYLCKGFPYPGSEHLYQEREIGPGGEVGSRTLIKFILY